MDGSLDRHRGYSRSVEFGYRLSESRERLMNGRDQDRQLGCADICSNDFGREFSIERWGRRFAWHFGSPCRDRQNTTPGQFETVTKPSPYGFAAPLTSLLVPPVQTAPLSSVESTWEVESEIYSGDFSGCMGRFTEFTMF